jgi:hypothetical protein
VSRGLTKFCSGNQTTRDLKVADGPERSLFTGHYLPGIEGNSTDDQAAGKT